MECYYFTNIFQDLENFYFEGSSASGWLGGRVAFTAAFFTFIRKYQISLSARD